MKKFKLGTLATLILSVALPVSYANAAKTLVYCLESSPVSFNPQLVTDGASADASAVAVYNRLVEFKLGTTEVLPGLAEKWDISADGKEYTFYLRKGVKFHSNKTFTPTRDFNADDVIFSFNRQLDKNHPYHKVSNSPYEYFTSMDMPNIIDSIEKVDDYTVKFKLKKVNAPFVANLGMAFASILSAEYGEKLLKANKAIDIDNFPIGTGPFVFINYQKDSTVRYQAFDNYWDGRPKLDRLVFSITIDPAVRYAKLQKGECHIMPFPNPSDIEKMRADTNINVLEKEGLNVGYVALNVTRKPLDDLRIRQALNYATNKDAIIKAIYQGTGTIAKNPIPPTIWSYNDTITDYEYNPEKAKALLKEAGYEKGFDIELWAMPVSRPYNPNAKKMAELMQEDWKKLGINAKIVSYEWGEYLNRLNKGEADTSMAGWTGDNGDPDNFMGTLLSCASANDGSNYAKWCHKPFDDLIQKAATVSDPEARTKLYKEAQVIFKQQAPWITIAHSQTFVPMRTNVKNYVIDPLGLHYFSKVDLE